MITKTDRTKRTGAKINFMNRCIKPPIINDNNKLVGFIITEISLAVHYNRNYCHRRLFEKMIHNKIRVYKECGEL